MFSDVIEATELYGKRHANALVLATCFDGSVFIVSVYNKVGYRTPRCHCNTSFPCYTGKRSTLITSGFGERELQEPTETHGKGTVLCIGNATEYQGQ